MDNFLGGGFSFYTMAMNEMFNFESQQEKCKERIKQKFRESCNLPRNKKKTS